MWSWRLSITFHVSRFIIWGFSPSFPKLSLSLITADCNQHCTVKGVILWLPTQLFVINCLLLKDISFNTKCLLILLELKTLNYFLYSLAHDLGFWAQFPPQIVIMPKIPKNKSNSILRLICQSSKALFNVNHGIREFKLLFIYPSSWFEVSGPGFPKLS